MPCKESDVTLQERERQTDTETDRWTDIQADRYTDIQYTTGIVIETLADT